MIMENTQLEQEILELFAQIERREVKVKLIGPEDHYATNVDYETSNGWRLTVFDDCDSWDYLDTAITPDGRKWEFDDSGKGFFTEVERYRPHYNHSREIWGMAP